MAAERKPVIEIFKSDPTLGSGAFGVVYRARFNELPCAAKVLHRLLLETSDPGRHTILQKFYQECELIKTITHPNIVQYLDHTNDPESDLPVLLMELLNESLTKYLDRIKKPPAYHIQVNLSHDVALAIAHLHSKGIIHRDLSSNNVLLAGGLKAKVSDFGMSKIVDVHGTFSQRSITPLPGTYVVMPPEAFFEPPHYSNKIDCFSFGTLLIQLMTSRFPEPGPRFTMKTDSNSPVGFSQVPVLEEERRKNHIAMIKPFHSLLPIAKQCLTYRPEERPTARQLCIQVVQLKKEEQYSESIEIFTNVENETETDKKALATIQEKLKSVQKHLHDEIQHKEEIIEQLKRKYNELSKKEAEVQELALKLSAKEKDCQQLQESLAAAKNTMQEKELCIESLKLKLQDTEHQLDTVVKVQGVVQKESLDSTVELLWRRPVKAPCKMYRGSTAVDENVVYFKSGQNKDIHQYNTQQEKWQRLPACARFGFALALVEGTLTTVGGTDVHAKETNTLFSFIHEKWTQKYSPMPTKRTNTTTATTKQLLIVIGGVVDGKRQIPTVELLHVTENQWYKACDLPHIMYQPSATICSDNIYLTGWKDSQNQPSTGVISACLSKLKEYSTKDSIGSWFSALTGPKHEPTDPIWTPLPVLPVIDSSCATINGNQLVAIGGENTETNVYTNSIYHYNIEENAWIKISEIEKGRSSSLVAVISKTKKVLVVGGFTGVGLFTDAIDIGSYP